jgi:TolA-binding protein
MCGVLLVSAVSWAAVCPLCLQTMPEGEKFCARHKAEMLAKTLSAGDEKRLVDDLARARADYEAKLEALGKHYDGVGNAARSLQVRNEIKDHAAARHFEYVNWEDCLPALSAKEEKPEATALLKEADTLRTAINPLNRGTRFKDAAVKYQEILIHYPTSNVVDSAAFALGEIYSSGAVKEYARAVKLYELAYLANPKGNLDACYRAAQVCDEDLAQHENAARFYWLAARTSNTVRTRERAAARLVELQKKSFGRDYSLEDKPAEKPATPPPVAPAK